MHDPSHQRSSHSSLKTAEAVCRRCLPSDGEIAPDKLFDQREIQVQNLEEWARTGGLLIDSERLPALIERTNEHLVAFRTSDRRWVKATKPGCFAYIADTDYILDRASQKWVGNVILREALPSEYLARLRLHNDVFGDSIELEGAIISPDGKLSLVSSQPDISGTPASLEEIKSTMKGLGFEVIDGLHLGYTVSLSFFRRADRVVVFDAHPANAITSDGIAVPIDFIVQVATDSMVAELEKH